MATKWLENSKEIKNRRISESTVQKWASDMAEGRWKPNPQVMMLDANDGVLDGQHRLWAIIESNTSQWMNVSRQVPSDIIDVADSGNARTTAQVLSMLGIAQPYRVATIARVALMYDLYPEKIWNQTIRISKIQAQLYAREYPDQMQIAAQSYDRCYTDKMLLVPPRMVGAAVFVIVQNSQRLALLDDFARGVGTGIGLEHGDARLALRRYGRTTTTMLGGGQRFEQIGVAVVLKSWNAFVSGKKAVNIRWDIKELPMPKVI